MYQILASATMSIKSTPKRMQCSSSIQFAYSLVSIRHYRYTTLNTVLFPVSSRLTRLLSSPHFLLLISLSFVSHLFLLPDLVLALCPCTPPIPSMTAVTGLELLCTFPISILATSPASLPLSSLPIFSLAAVFALNTSSSLESALFPLFFGRGSLMIGHGGGGIAGLASMLAALVRNEVLICSSARGLVRVCFS